jgi:CRISPR/Cas system CSM-associated protein Csm3 (group 7 of RAMP superfamily)
MADVVVALQITLETPLSIGAGGSSGSLADKTIVRDGWGRPFIPGSQVKGRARHAAEALARALGLHVAELWQRRGESLLDPACPIRAIFGGPTGWRDRSSAPARGDIAPLRFRDLRLRDDAPVREDTRGLRRSVIRPSVAINRRRGVAEDARLLFQETTVEALTFGNERAIAGTLAEERQLALLVAALRMVDRWGGAKSRGLGWARVEVAATWDGQAFAVTPDALDPLLRQWEGVA